MTDVKEMRRNASMALVVQTGIVLRDQVGMAEGISYLKAHGIPQITIFRVLGIGRRRI